MAFSTKINLSDNKSEQLSGQTLSLSGNTHIYGQLIVDSGATLCIIPNYGLNKVLTSDASGIATWQDPSGGTYNLDSPSVCCVGGMCVGTTLTGKTAFEILSEILVPELFGVLTAPSTAISILPATTLYEIGCSISTLCVTGTFNQGCINPQYCSASPKRSGLPNTYNFTGCQIAGSYACTTSPVTKCATGYTVCATQSWSVSTSYDAGVQPKGSKGSDFCTPLPTGTSNIATSTITGIYPYYYGKLTNGSRPPVTNDLVTGGTKVLAVSTSTVTVTFSSAGQWTWLAIPQASTSKTCWFVNALDNGRINNAPSDKYPDECIFSVCSGEGCWTGVNYKIYMSGFAATDANPIQFRNS